MAGIASSVDSLPASRLSHMMTAESDSDRSHTDTHKQTPLPNDRWSVYTRQHDAIKPKGIAPGPHQAGLILPPLNLGPSARSDAATAVTGAPAAAPQPPHRSIDQVHPIKFIDAAGDEMFLIGAKKRSCAAIDSHRSYLDDDDDDLDSHNNLAMPNFVSPYSLDTSDYKDRDGMDARLPPHYSTAQRNYADGAASVTLTTDTSHHLGEEVIDIANGSNEIDHNDEEANEPHTKKIHPAPIDESLGKDSGIPVVPQPDSPAAKVVELQHSHDRLTRALALTFILSAIAIGCFLFLWQFNPEQWLTKSTLPPGTGYLGNLNENGALQADTNTTLLIGAITNRELAPLSVNETNLMSGAVSTRTLANGGVTSDKFDSVSVTDFIQQVILLSPVSLGNASNFVSPGNVSFGASDAVNINTGDGGFNINTLNPSSTGNGSVSIITNNFHTNTIGDITFEAGANGTEANQANIEMISYLGAISLTAAELRLESTVRSTAIQSAQDILLRATSGNIGLLAKSVSIGAPAGSVLELADSGSVSLNSSSGAILMFGAAGIDVSTHGSMAIASSGILSIESTGSTGGISLAAGGGGALNLSSTGGINLLSSSGAFDLNASAGIMMSTEGGAALHSQGSIAVSSTVGCISLNSGSSIQLSSVGGAQIAGSTVQLASSQGAVNIVGGENATVTSVRGDTNIASESEYLNLSGYKGINLYSSAGSVTFYAPIVSLVSNTSALFGAGGSTQIYSSSGLASMRGVETLQESFGPGGQATIRSMHGNVWIESSEQHVQMKAKNGTIAMEAKDVAIESAGALNSTSTSSTSITSTGGDVVVSSLSGGVSVHADGDVRLNTVVGELQLVGAAIRAEATVANVTVTAKQAVELTSSTAGVKMTAGTSIQLHARSQIHIGASTGSMRVDAQSVSLNAVGSQGIDLSADGGSFNASSLFDLSMQSLSGSISLDSGAGLNLKSRGLAGSTIVAEAGPVSMAAIAGAVSIDAKADISLTSQVGGMAAVAKKDVRLTSTTGEVALTAGGANGIQIAANSGAIAMRSASSTDIIADADVGITSKSAIHLNSTAALTLSSTSGSILTSGIGFEFAGSEFGSVEFVTGGQVRLDSTNGGVTATGMEIEITAREKDVTMASVNSGVRITANTEVNLTAAGSVQITSSAASLTLDGGASLQTQVGPIRVSSGSDLVLRSVGDCSMDSGADLKLSSVGASMLNAAGGVKVESTTSQIQISAQENIQLGSADGSTLVDMPNGWLNVTARLGARIESEQEIQLHSGSTLALAADQNIFIQASNNIDVLTNGDMKVKATSIDIDTTGDISLRSSTAAIQLHAATGPIDLKGTAVTLQSGSAGTTISSQASVAIAAQEALSISATSIVSLASPAVSVSSSGSVVLASSSASSGIALHAARGRVNITSRLTQINGALQQGEQTIHLTSGANSFTIDFDTIGAAMLRFAGAPNGPITINIANCDDRRTGMEVKIINAMNNSLTDLLLLSKSTCMDLFSSTVGVGNFATVSCLGSAVGVAPPTTTKAFCTRPLGGAAGIAGINATGTILQGATPGSVILNAPAGQINLNVLTAFPNYSAATFWLVNDQITASHVGVQFTSVYSGAASTGVLIVTNQKIVPGYGVLCTVMNVGVYLPQGEVIAFVFQLI